jgi:uncharacterized protein (TIGR02145 family)
LYFSWGGTEGATKDGIENGKFTFGTYGNMVAYFDSSTYTFTKYNATDGKIVLDLEDDAVHVHMGGDWHMPTKEQFEELISTANTSSKWTSKNGVNGRLFTSKTNGNSVFVPAFGLASDSGFGSSVGTSGCVWSSSVNEDFLDDAWSVDFNSSNMKITKVHRIFGFNVLGVVG